MFQQGNSVQPQYQQQDPSYQMAMQQNLQTGTPYNLQGNNNLGNNNGLNLNQMVVAHMPNHHPHRGQQRGQQLQMVQMQANSEQTGPIVFGRHPVPTICESCQCRVLTRITNEYTTCMWIYLVIAMILCFPMYCIPCVLKSDAIHICPMCRRELGRGDYKTKN